MEEHIITFGVKLTVNGKYGICTDINEDGKQYHRIDLSYKRMDFALTKAESFVKGLYKNFTDQRGIKHKFVFVNRGLI